MTRSEAGIATAQAGKYLQQLCKHFAHRRPVTFDPRKGEIHFDAGDVHLKAEDNLLKIALTAPDDARMAELQDIIVRHLVRFAFREALKIEWRPAESA
jgi:hypothetical protein